jgi:hypothetical protein
MTVVRVTAPVYSDPEGDAGERISRVYPHGESTAVESSGWITPTTTHDFELADGYYELTVQDKDTFGEESNESERYSFGVGEFVAELGVDGLLQSQTVGTGAFYFINLTIAGLIHSQPVASVGLNLPIGIGCNASNFKFGTTPGEGQNPGARDGWVPVPRVYKRRPLGSPLF